MEFDIEISWRRRQRWSSSCWSTLRALSHCRLYVVRIAVTWICSSNVFTTGDRETFVDLLAYLYTMCAPPLDNRDAVGLIAIVCVLLLLPSCVRLCVLWSCVNRFADWIRRIDWACRDWCRCANCTLANRSIPGAGIVNRCVSLMCVFLFKQVVMLAAMTSVSSGCCCSAKCTMPNSSNRTWNTFSAQTMYKYNICMSSWYVFE